MRTCIAATRKVSHVFIYKYVYKVSGAHAPLGPTVDTPLGSDTNRNPVQLAWNPKWNLKY